MNFLPGWFPGGGVAAKIPSIVYQTMVPNTAQNQTSYTNNGVPFGPASPRRRIFVGVPVTSVNAFPDVMTIGGVSANVAVQVQQGAGSTRCQIWSAIVPTGTSGTVFYSISSGDMDGSAIYVWSAYDLKDSVPYATAIYNSGGSAANVSVNTLGNGIVIALARISNLNPNTITFSGVSNDSQTSTPSNIHTGGHAGLVLAETPRVITASWGTGFAPTACALSWR